MHSVLYYPLAEDHLSRALFAAVRSGDRRRVENVLAEGANVQALSEDGFPMDLCPRWDPGVWTLVARAGGLGIFDWLRKKIAGHGGTVGLKSSERLLGAIVRTPEFVAMEDYLFTPGEKNGDFSGIAAVLGLAWVVVDNGAGGLYLESKEGSPGL